MKENKKTLIVTAEMAQEIDTINEKLTAENKEVKKAFYATYSFVADVMRNTYVTKSAQWTQTEDGTPEIKVKEKVNYPDLLTAVKALNPKVYDITKKHIETLENIFASFISQSIDGKTAPSNSQLIKICDTIVKDSGIDFTTKFISADVKYLAFIATRKGREHGTVTGKARKALNDMMYCKFNGIKYQFVEVGKKSDSEPNKGKKSATK